MAKVIVDREMLLDIVKSDLDVWQNEDSIKSAYEDTKSHIGQVIENLQLMSDYYDFSNITEGDIESVSHELYKHITAVYAYLF